MEKLDPTRDKKEQGLIQKYVVARLDGKPVGEGIFLEFKDPSSWGPFRLWADIMAGKGYTKLAVEIRDRVNAEIELNEIQRSLANKLAE